jgi:DNA excision repair protein ERCC-4
MLARMPSIQVVTAALASGDYSVGDTLGIERKTAADLARSIIDGRLFRQTGSLRRAYRRPFLLVEGLCEGAPVEGVSWPALRGALVSVAVSFGVPVLRSIDATDSAVTIATAARQLYEPLDIPYVRPGYRPTGWQRRALYILQGLPSVGPRRARALLRRFGSVSAVVAADVSCLASVAEIGAAVARAIRGALDEERVPGLSGHAPNEESVPPIRSPSHRNPDGLL